METRRLGSAGLISSAIGLGCASLVSDHGVAARAEHVQTIRAALGVGVTMLDTADFYGGGATERLIGTAVAGHREDVLIATHGGARFADDGRLTGLDGSPGYLSAACDASLRRLRTGWIDLYYLWRPDPRIPIEESVGALGQLVACGKVRWLGLPEVSADELRRAHAVHPVSALAAEYSLCRRSPETGATASAAELGIGLVACRPLAGGLLAGQAKRGTPPAAGPGRQAALDALAAEAAALDVGLARLSLAWLLSRRPDVVPVPGTRRRFHAEMNAAAANVRLTAGDAERLAALFPAGLSPAGW